MARTTNSDTLPFVESRYELGMLASQRVRDLNGGATPVVERGGDKATVTALREIASGKLDIPAIRHEFVQSYKETPTVENAEETLEVNSVDPALREIDAELEESLMTEEPVDAAELVEEDVADDDASDDE
ncbi:MAG: DNA-directed RNA polymerase subunit omega [Alphaproteobacteria bacterium]|nr:DNA-directed RNA polymerase subunit omega [Alphaproteobacteria bacterium]